MEFVARYELLPAGKASVIKFNNNGTEIFVLYSHTVPVLVSINKKLYRVENDGTYTTSTLRDCREFARQFNYSTKTKKEFLKLKIYNF